MKLNKKLNIVILLTMGMLFILSSIPYYDLSINPVYSTERLEYSNNINFDKKNLKLSSISEKIHIDNNWSVARDMGICTGNGTFSDPYVIKNLIIDGKGSESCILIENSNVHFKIENCTLFNSNEGISMKNTNSGQILNNSCSNNGGYGLVLRYSNNNTISGNIANNNSVDGISISGDNNTISGNTANNNPYYGIYLFGDNNTISENTANNNNDDGIVLGGDTNIVSGNTANSNNDDGIVLGGDTNIVSGNTANNNNDDGMVLGGDINIVSENTVNNNNDDGIYLLVSNNNILSENLMNECGLGMFGTLETLLSHEIDTTNLVNGKPLYYYTNKVNLSSNDFTNAGQVILVNCRDSVISNLNVSYNSIGISLYYCDNNTISENTANNNNDNGIYLLHSNNNTISENIANNNADIGISLVYSDYNSISENIVYNNGIGTYLLWSEFNFIVGNILIGNNECMVEENCEGNVFEFNYCGEVFPLELLILVLSINGGAVIGAATLLLIRFKKRRLRSSQ